MEINGALWLGNELWLDICILETTMFSTLNYLKYFFWQGRHDLVGPSEPFPSDVHDKTPKNELLLHFNQQIFPKIFRKW